MTLFGQQVALGVWALVASTASAWAGFPQSWVGRWKGEVSVLGAPAGAAVPKFTMELDIAPTSVPEKFTWTIIYDGSAGKQERPYTLVVKDAANGQYEIDENNGIVLPARLLGGVLHSTFLVEGSRISSRDELVGAGTPDEAIRVELTSFVESAARTSGGKDTPEVQGWAPTTVQHAMLKRIDGAPKDAAKASSGDSKSTSTLSAGEKPADAKPNEKPDAKTDSKPDSKTDAKLVPSGREALAASALKWTKFKTEAYPGKQDDVFFVSPTTGWYVNGAGKIFKTTDGGQTWVQKLHKPGTYFRCIAFVDANVGFAGNIGPGYFPNVSDAVPLYETRDGGETWNPVTTIEGPPVVGLCALEVVSIPFVNAGNLDHKTRIVGVGRVGGPAAFVMSDDLGKTWTQLKLPESCAMAFDVHFFDEHHGVIASASSADVQESHALILTTEDGGKTWREAFTSARPFELTWKISFPTREVGYVTIQNYNPDPKVSQRFVAKTTDGGKTWAEIPLVDDPKVRQFGVGFVDDKHGWVGAVPGGFETTDGGATWQKSDMGNAVNKIRVVREGGKTRLFAIGVSVSTLEVP